MEILSSRLFENADFTELTFHTKIVFKETRVIKFTKEFFPTAADNKDNYLELIYLDSSGNIITKELKIGESIGGENLLIKKLGLFLVDFRVGEKNIKRSLESVEKAAAEKADILVCSYQDSPIFHDRERIIYDPKQDDAPLNIRLKILKALSLKTNAGYHSVSFLSSDMIYPKDYFDFGAVEESLSNDNIVLLGNEGWYSPVRKNTALNQYTMRFELAPSYIQGGIFISMRMNNFGMGVVIGKKHISYMTVSPAIYIKNEITYIPYLSNFEIVPKENHEVLGNYKDYE